MDNTWTDSSTPSLETRQQGQAAGENSAGLLEQVGLSVDQHGDCLQIQLHQGRQKIMALFVLVFAFIFASAALLLPEQSPNAWLFRLVFATFAIGLALVGIYLPFNSLELHVSRQAVTRVRRFFGLVIRRQQIHPRQIRSLDIGKPSAAPTAGGAASSYRLVGKGEFGTVCLLDGISERLLMESLQQQIISAAGLSRERVAAG